MLKIITPRTSIVPINLQDDQFLLELMNTKGWLTFIGDKYIENTQHARTYIIDSIIPAYKSPTMGMRKIVLKSSNTPIGICGFVQRTYLDLPDIGFALLPQFSKKGYMLEACRALLAYGKVRGIHPCAAITTSSNVKSQQLLKRLGFQQQQHLPPQMPKKFMLFSNQSPLPQC
ncbi:GNAT family N-acetyltransferase [Persicobacter psychrovividus]|uniref:N-acetyltransferase GCN5 n=1 Tax=Persicobacter psychrovividus TaxID=387638 RepID=A0ABM7VJE1_9BACT|nr:N-acetyltransferase GCN5 [Persicobacter psychrovividus]